jgi:hypothetical protein
MKMAYDYATRPIKPAFATGMAAYVSPAKPVNAVRLVLTGKQPKLEKMIAERARLAASNG